MNFGRTQTFKPWQLESTSCTLRSTTWYKFEEQLLKDLAGGRGEPGLFSQRKIKEEGQESNYSSYCHSRASFDPVFLLHCFRFFSPSAGTPLVSVAYIVALPRPSSTGLSPWFLCHFQIVAAKPVYKPSTLDKRSTKRCPTRPLGYQTFLLAFIV